MGYIGTFPKNTTVVQGLPINRIRNLEIEVAILMAMMNSSGNGVSLISITGSIDDVNTSFSVSSFVQSLTQIVVNGIPYSQTGGSITWSLSGTALTISSPVGLNGTIFGIGLSFTQLTTGGTIDDINTIFSFSSKPNLLDINGAYYQQTGGAITWTWNGTYAMISNPVGLGGSISGLF